MGFAKRINERWSWGVTIYGNGGLNTNYADDTGVPGTNQNPARCGNRPGNFFFGCGELGFDLAQVLIAPTLAWRASPKHGFGISPLLAFQRFSAYGLQAFEPLSTRPNDVSNNGYDKSLGAGVRVGWYGELLPQLKAGIAYSSRVYMQRFDRYDGLLADGGRFDIPSVSNVGLAYSPFERVTLGLDFRRIFYGEIRALANGVQNSLLDPVNQPLGSRNGSGFNWRHQSNYHGVIAFKASPTWTLRAGFAWGRRPQADNDINSVSFNMLTPNPIRNITAGFTKQMKGNQELSFAYGRYLKGFYQGPSATPVGGQERVRAFVDTFMVSWSWRFIGD